MVCLRHLTHFGHSNIIKSLSNWTDVSNCRDFSSIEEHDSYIIDQINKRVKSTDYLYHLGDFGFGFNKLESFPKLRERIKCENITLILGNHDHVFEKHSKYAGELRKLFKRVEYFYFRSLNKQNIVMCHYAMKTWPWQHQESWNLYGHSHGSLPNDENSLSLDVGVDTTWYGHEKYTPYSFEEIDHIMKNYKKMTVIDHHNGNTN